MTARQLTKQELDALRTDMQAASVLMKVALAERRQEKLCTNADISHAKKTNPRSGDNWGCKPEPPKFPSCQFHPFHKGIQVNHLAVTLKGIVSVQQNVSPGCRRYLGERRERLGVTCCFALR